MRYEIECIFEADISDVKKKEVIGWHTKDLMISKDIFFSLKLSKIKL